MSHFLIPLPFPNKDILSNILVFPDPLSPYNTLKFLSKIYFNILKFLKLFKFIFLK